jgi:putative SOS response-associated peptidase YedK
MTAIHDRMPVLIAPEAWARWLDPAPADPGELRALLEPRDDVALDARAVSMLVNNVRNDGPELIEVAPLTGDRPGAPEPPTLS